jgi:hypothetical protein
MLINVERPVRVMLIDDNIIDLKINSKIILISKLFDEIIQCQSGEEALSYFTSRCRRWMDLSFLTTINSCLKNGRPTAL